MNDYYPFGMLQPGRNYNAPSAADYRYGFNGKENDNEAKGEGNEQDYGMRIYDPRLGRFLSVDPLTKSYPWYTPYQFAGNKPIIAIDLDGKEEEYIIGPVYWMAKDVITKNSYANEVVQGFYERAAQTIHGFKEIFENKEEISSNQIPLFHSSTLGFTQEEVASQNRTVDWIAKLGPQVLYSIITDYAHLIQGAYKGDGKKAGALLFEALMFFGPGKEAEAVSVIENGVREFKVVEEIVVESDKGLEWVEESQKGMSEAAKTYEDGATGARSSVESQKKVVPALRYRNPNPNGARYVKFDGIEEESMTLIDRKRSIYTSKKGLAQLRRQSEAIGQNPEYKAIIEVPNEKQLRRLNRVLDKLDIKNISGRVVKE